MRTTIIYILVFSIAFVGTTAVIYTLNNQYKNIFAFDFSQPSTELNENVALNDTKIDSLQVADTLISQNNEINYDTLYENLNKANLELSKIKEELLKRDKEITLLKEKIKDKNDAEYDKWLKSTIKLYEEMQPGRAAKLIATLPEDNARDIIYSIKTKKAAEILSSLDTEIVKKLTKAKK